MPEKIAQRKHFLINTAYITLVIILSVLVVLSANIILPFWIALILAAVLQPIVQALSKKVHLKKKSISAIVLIIFYLIAGSIIVFGIIEVAYLLEEVFEKFPQYFNDTIQPGLNTLGDTFERMLSVIPAPIRPNFEAVQMNVMEAMQNSVSSISQRGAQLVGDFLNSIASSFLAVLVTIMLSYFVIVQYDFVMDFLKNQIPERICKSASSLKALLKNSVLKYVKATAILMMITFVELSIGLFIIGAANPIGMAAGIALFDALPVFGTGGIMMPWALIELLNGNYSFAAAILVLYVVVVVMRNLLEPKIIGSQLGLNPIVALVSIYAGFKLLGIIGMISFPIIAYVLLSLHNDGKIHLYKDLKA